MSFNRSSNPYFSGTKPRRFFEQRNQLERKNTITKKSGLKFNPDWNKEKQ